MVKDDLNAPKIGSVLSLERNREIQVGIDSCAAATVFAHFCWFVTKSCKSCVDLSARKVTCELRDVSFWCLNLKNGDDVRSLGGSVRERHESRCVLPLLRRRYLSACVPRGMWNETGAGAKRSLRVASRDCFGQCSDDKLELIAFGAEQIKDMTITIANSEHLQCLKRARQYITPEALLEALVEVDRLLEPLSKGARAALFNLREKQAIPSDTVTENTEPAKETKIAFDNKHVPMPIQELSSDMARNQVSTTPSKEFDGKHEWVDVAKERMRKETVAHTLPKHVPDLMTDVPKFDADTERNILKFHILAKRDRVAVNGEYDNSSSNAHPGAERWRRLALAPFW